MTATTERASSSTSVYRYFDNSDRLIYVGITSRGMRRQKEHNEHAEWWQYVVRQEVEHYGDRADAEQREAELIRLHHSPFNTQHNDIWQLVRPAYLTLRAAEAMYSGALSGKGTDGCMICTSDGADCDPCEYGASSSVGHDLEGVSCGRASCIVCHARFHGYEYGIPIGYDAGVTAGRTSVAPALGPCGHCGSCLAGDDQMCLVRDPWSERSCEVCGKSDCAWFVGVVTGRMQGWQEGYDQGRVGVASEQARRAVGEADDGVVDVRKLYEDPWMSLVPESAS